ncbi:hypothetical protein [Ruegeria atlantica]|uniref:hypothetical protein n=1 Tax=Ruegeria atlantica TaxID=81569 RepID=UPI002495958B|nr:hypothetical protein [Ruegeria atlantica]
MKTDGCSKPLASVLNLPGADHQSAHKMKRFAVRRILRSAEGELFGAMRRNIQSALNLLNKVGASFPKFVKNAKMCDFGVMRRFLSGTGKAGFQGKFIAVS